MARTPDPDEPTAADLIANGVPPEIANDSSPEGGVALTRWLIGEYENGNRSWG